MISTMKKQGFIDYDKDFIRLTELGRSKAKVDPLAMPVMGADNEATMAGIKERFKLGGMKGRLFDLLGDGRVHDRATVTNEIGCDNKCTLAVLLSNMKKREIIAYDHTTIQLSDLCFPYGRPTNSAVSQSI